MTISTAASSQTFLGNGSNTVFAFSFVADSASDIVVTYTNATGVITTIPTAQYTLVINPAAVGQIWGIGGQVTYPLSGSPIANGTFLTVARILPYTQTITISNQGDFAPQVIEEMGDTLEMQIQQVAARTTQFRGVWITNTDYTVGDIAQDGANGNNTKNYYICQVENTSGTWSTDLAAGDWAISVVATVPSGSNSLTLTGDITASGTIGSPIATTLATVNSNVGQFAGLTINAKGLTTAATALTGDITSFGASTTLATVNANVGSFTAANITVNAKGLVTAAATGTAGSVSVYEVTDSTDISLSSAPTQTNIGSSSSVTIPTKGLIELNFTGQLNGTNGAWLVLGIRIGSTNYFPVSDGGGTNYIAAANLNTSPTTYKALGAYLVGSSYAGISYPIVLSIEGMSIPTGVQTVQVVAAYGLQPATIKGTSLTTHVFIKIFNYS